MITGDQILLHLIGDYLTQSDRMALNKTKSHLWAGIHALVYSIPFLVLVHSVDAWVVIFVSHWLIDRYRLARYIVWLKNYPSAPWSDCQATGYPSDRPAWLTVWLMIAADNVLHMLVNGLCLRYL